MRNPFAAVARAISDLIAPGDEVRKGRHASVLYTGKARKGERRQRRAA